MKPKFDMNESFASVDAKFKLYRSLLNGVLTGSVRHLFVRGDPGLGKSHEAVSVLGAAGKGNRRRFSSFSGHVTPLSLYNSLNANKRSGTILMFDDCDSAFRHEQCLNILKAATDTKVERWIAWGSTSKLVDAQRFMYEGSLVVVTNVDLSSDRYESLRDRVHVFDITLTPEERVARIIQILMAMPSKTLYRDEVIMWLIENYGRLIEKLTIRSAIKALELANHNYENWKDLADATILGPA